ncbi:SusC/RagA family TonB-linked outer membrane protein [Bacteroides sp. 214]|uniref:SusC/RagA family TonB-linked outer membrane protein n=1 Tax=Bacteroides sp. 214 TaxID=2302935 RepID=UPI001EF2C98D|nr:SusC/RagA family TonB-linked outer membrane protein [Bacteroides sp. 214]
MKWVFCVCLLLLGSSTFGVAELRANSVEATQQSKTVKGTVVDELGDPIIGANVKVQGVAVGAITDINGAFSLSVPAGAKLEVSFIGCVTQVVAVPASGVVRVILKEDSQLLDEVVIVGYGTQRVKDLTGAAAHVKMDEIADLPGASIIDALAGQVVGLSVSQSDGRPGSTGSLKVRQPMAFGSEVAFNNPLIVIDDVVQVDEEGSPSMTAFNMLDHSEIETMTVLKDASAAIYGSRASAGVILVKTKRGQKGAPKISYSGKLDFSDAVSHTKVMNAYELGVFTNRLIQQGFTNDPKAMEKFLKYKYTDAELEQLKNTNHNWLDKAWDSAISHRHSLNVSGGAENMNFFAGLTYQKQETNMGSTQDYDKWTFRVGGDMKVAAGLTLSATIAGYNQQQVSSRGQNKMGSGPWGTASTSDDYTQLRHMPRYIPVEVEVLDPATGEMKNYYTSPWAGPYESSTTGEETLSGFGFFNYFANEKAASTTKDANGYNANFSLTYDVPFVKGLSLKGTYAVSYANTFSEMVGGHYTLARAINTDSSIHLPVHANTQYKLITYGNQAKASDRPGVVYTKGTTKTQQMNFMINYNRTFGKHEVAATGVVERGESEGTDQRTAYYDRNLLYTGASNTAGTLDASASATYLKKYESGSLSYIGRVNYKYDNRYLFQFLIRTDASTRFAPENYWGIFPTASVGWVISEEKFFQNSRISDIFDYLKIRASLGKTGKDNVKAWQWLQIYEVNATSGLGFGSSGGMQAPGATTTAAANRDLKWDSTIKQNYGIDFNVLDNRLSLSTDFYYDKTSDLIMSIPSVEEPIYIGATYPPMNYGKKDAWGWEFSIRWNDKINQNILPSWGPIKYGIGMDYGISWNKTVLGNDEVFDYPAYYAGASEYTGYHSPDHTWGLKTWKETSQGDGMLRTQADIDKYWAYLEANAIASGRDASTVRYFKKTKSEMYPGMIAYKDLRGDIDADNKTWAGPDGIISDDHGQDLGKLANNRRHGINTKLSAQWGNFSWNAQLSTSWGGYTTFVSNTTQGIGEGTFIWSQFAYMNDMFDPEENPNGKYPSMAAKVSNAFTTSDFWQVSSFRMYVRNMSFSYSFPKDLLKNTGIDKVAITLTGNNLWDFYNPYPKKFKNNYDAIRTNYPTLRTWTLGVNLTF